MRKKYHIPRRVRRRVLRVGRTREPVSGVGKKPRSDDLDDEPLSRAEVRELRRRTPVSPCLAIRAEVRPVLQRFGRCLCDERPGTRDVVQVACGSFGRETAAGARNTRCPMHDETE